MVSRIVLQSDDLWMDVEWTSRESCRFQSGTFWGALGTPHVGVARADLFVTSRAWWHAFAPLAAHIAVPKTQLCTRS